MNAHYAPTSALLLLAIAGSAWAETYTIDPKHTFPSFEVSHLGFSTQRGRFDRTTGTVRLDAKAKTGAIEIRIDADSIDTGLKDLEAKLREAEFFNTAVFPNILFQSQKVEFSGDAPVAADGTLTLMGVSQPVRLSIDHFRCGVHPISKREVCGADASAQIKRSDFGLKAFLPAIGDEVKIHIQVEAFKD